MYKWMDYDEYRFLKGYSNFLQWCMANKLKPNEQLRDHYLKWVDELMVIAPQFNDSMNALDACRMKRYGDKILEQYPDHYKVLEMDDRRIAIDYYRKLRYKHAS